MSKRLWLYSAILILFSLLIFSNTNDEHHLLGWACAPVLISLLKEVGIALFIVGSITILLELGDFTEYFFSRLRDIMIDDAYIERFTDEQKKALKAKIEERLFFKNKKVHDPNSFFYTVQNEVSPLLEDYYHNEYTINIECSIQDDIIKKTMYKRIEVVNPTNNPIDVTIPFETYMQKIDGYDNQSHYHVKLLKIDSKDKLRDIKLNYIEAFSDEKEFHPIDEKYNLKVCCDYIVKVTDKCVIEMVTETITPLTDIHYMHRTFKPCKNYNVTFILFNDSYSLTGYGFGFMEKEKLVKHILENGIVIRFNDWILPGDGVIFTITKK
jgi:hypothetical protein